MHFTASPFASSSALNNANAGGSFLLLFSHTLKNKEVCVWHLLLIYILWDLLFFPITLVRYQVCNICHGRLSNFICLKKKKTITMTNIYLFLYLCPWRTVTGRTTKDSPIRWQKVSNLQLASTCSGAPLIWLRHVTATLHILFLWLTQWCISREDLIGELLSDAATKRTNSTLE